MSGATEKIYKSHEARGSELRTKDPDVGGPVTAPTSSLERKDIYLPYAQTAGARAGHAYYCFCTKEDAWTERRAAAEAEKKGEDLEIR